MLLVSKNFSFSVAIFRSKEKEESCRYTIETLPCFGKDVTQVFLKRNFSLCTPLCSYFTGIRRKRERKEEIQRRRKKKSMGARKSKKERDHRVLVRDSLSYGINGGLMGYERMFYWKQ